MIAAVLLLSAWASATLGAALIALTSSRHWNAVAGSSTRLPRRRWNRICGGLLLLLTVILAVLRDGWGMGLLLGPLVVATGIATIIALLAVRPASLRIVRVLVPTRNADRRP